jgi:hypothetical protein
MPELIEVPPIEARIVGKKKPTDKPAGKPGRGRPQKPVDERQTDRQKNMVRVQDDVHELMKQLAERNSRPLSWEVRLALIAHLQAAGMWPPPPAPPTTPSA